MAMHVLVLGLVASSVTAQAVHGTLSPTASCAGKMAALLGDGRIASDLRNGDVAAKAFVGKELDAACGGGEGVAAVESFLALSGPMPTLRQRPLETSSWIPRARATDTTEAMDTATDFLNAASPTDLPLYGPESSPSSVGQKASPSDIAPEADRCSVMISYAAKDKTFIRELCAGLVEAKDPVRVWLDEVCKTSDYYHACRNLNLIPNSPVAHQI